MARPDPAASPDRPIDIWINCPDRAVADRIAEAAIEARLAACANVLAQVSSLYRWQGALERAEEVPLILKTRARHFDAVAALARSLHPYEVPSIVATPLEQAEAAYAGWLHAETEAPQAAVEYRPRRAWFQGLVQAGPATIKLNTICADGAHVDADTLARAGAVIASAAGEIAATDHRGAGFAVLHEGEQGRWLLLHWWLAGGIAARKLWRADLVPHSPFVEAAPHLMACVWELGVIDFERRAWMRTAMSGKPVPAYIDDRFCGGTV